MNTAYVFWGISVILLPLFLWAIYKGKLSKHIMLQWVNILGIFALFFFAALFSKTTVKTQYFWIVMYACWIFLPLLSMLWQIAELEGRENYKKISGLHVKAVLKCYKYEIIIVIFTIATRLFLLEAEQKWDSSEYYFGLMKACKGFDFSLNWIIEYFDLCGHPTYALTVFLAIGEFLMPENVTGALMVQLTLTCIANVKLYHLFMAFSHSILKKRAFISTIICSCIPIYWAGMGCVMPDYLMAIFAIFVLSSEVNKRYLSLVFWSVVTCLCKEVGFVVIAGYFAIKYFIRFVQVVRRKCSLKERVTIFFKNRVIISGLYLLAAALGYLIVSSGVSKWTHSVYYSNTVSATRSDLSYNTFSFQADNIITRMLQFFVANFLWICSIVVIVGVVILFYKKKQNKKFFICGKYISGMVGMGLAYSFFMYSYVTAGEMRYNVMFSIFYVVIACLMLNEIFIKKRLVYVLASVGLLVLFIGQSCYPIDIVTNRVFRTVDVGDTEMMCISQKEHLNPGGDYYINNLQYRNIEYVFEAFLDTIDYSDKDTILIAGSTTTECTTVGSLMEWHGRHNDKYWNIEKRQLVNAYTKTEDLLSVNTLTTNELWGWSSAPVEMQENEEVYIQSKLNSIKGRVVVYFSPMYQKTNEENIMQKLAKYFYVGKRKQIEEKGFILYYYEMYKKVTANVIEEDDRFLNSPLKVPDAKISEPDSYKNKKGKIVTYNYSAEYKELYNRIEEKEIQQVMYRYLGSVNKTIKEDRNITKAGDTIAVNIACYNMNGEFINLGCSPKGVILTQVLLGAGKWINDIDEALIGCKVGERIDVETTFPEEYSLEPLLAGKTVKMCITICAIQYESISVEEYLNSTESSVETESAWREQIKDYLISQELSKDEILIYTTKNSDIKVTNKKKNKYKDAFYQLLYSHAQNVGIMYDTLVSQYMELDEDSLQKYSDAYAMYLAKKEILEKYIK